MSEEARALAYRQQQARRDQWERDNAIRLQGDPAAAQAVRDDWQPVRDAAKDARASDPIEEERHDRVRWSPA